MINQKISIHALLAESDLVTTHGAKRVRNFYPRSPCGERLWVLRKVPLLGIFLSTLSLRRATHYDNYNLHCVEISIHALLAESDLGGMSERLIGSVFLSTLSLRRATRFILGFFGLSAYFYPRSPCGERQPALYQLYDTYAISIHALLAESDVAKSLAQGRDILFLSTLSLRRATADMAVSYSKGIISIHALLAESDMGLDGRFKL